MLSETEDPTPIYRVQVTDDLGIKTDAYLEPAQQADMPSRKFARFYFRLA